MTEAKKTKWLGGPIRWGKKGPTYIVERWIDGHHWHVSTKCRTERAALKELEKFEVDPRGYRKARAAKTATSEMTPELIAEYLLHMEARKLDPPYIESHRGYLRQVMVALEGRDLSRTSFIELKDAINKASDVKAPAAAAARARAVKAFCKWMRKSKGLLTRTNDPSLDLTIAHQTAEKNRRKKAMPIEMVERAVAKMDPDIADVAITLAATGLHISELRRLHSGRGGLFEPADWQKPDGVLLNVAVGHKDKDKTHVVALTDPMAVAAVRRVMAREDFPTKGRIMRHVITLRTKTGEHFSMGWLRHSVSTWLALQRVDLQAISDQLGHVDTKQARETYIDLGMSARPVPIPRLKLVKS